MPDLQAYKASTCGQAEYLVLKALLDADDGAYVSGSRLAEMLGVSRPTVWAKIRRLTDEGYRFEAIRNRGYRLLSRPARLHPGLLRYHFERAHDAPPVHYYPALDSTNSEAERLLSFGTQAPFCVASSCQELGRGRLGRNWVSTSSENLYLSIAFAPDMPPKRLQDFTLWAGILICRALQPWTEKVPLRIKWPNDLLCRGRKFAGMLTEAKMDADRTRSIVFGTGLNLNSNPLEYPPEIRQSATSLRAATGEELPMNRIAADVAVAVCKAYDICIHNPETNALVEAWDALDALAGEPVAARQGNEVLHGIARGIDGGGALRIESADGAIHTVRAGDVTLRKD